MVDWALKINYLSIYHEYLGQCHVTHGHNSSSFISSAQCHTATPLREAWAIDLAEKSRSDLFGVLVGNPKWFPKGPYNHVPSGLKCTCAFLNVLAWPYMFLCGLKCNWSALHVTVRP